MNRSACLLICLFFQLPLLQSQVQESFTINDTFYRYTATLKSEIQKFENIQLQQLNFPCVDILKVRNSNIPDVQFELFTDDHVEFYNQEATMLKAKGYLGNDPFLGMPNHYIKYDEALPMVRSNRKDDFYNKAESEFFISYRVKDLRKEIRNWAGSRGISEIRVLTKVEFLNSYKQADQFDDYNELVEGFVIDNNLKYSVKSIELKIDKWTSIELDDYPFLADLFYDKQYKYLSFFSYDNLTEKARIQFQPELKFYFNSTRILGNHPHCKHKGTNIYLYPNPTFGDLNARFSNAETGTYQFSLVNVIGKVLWSTKLNVNNFNQEISIVLPSLAKGVYLYNITNPEGKRIQSRRLVIVEP